MASNKSLELSIVAPVYNESGYINDFHESLSNALKEINPGGYEIIYCNDGSSDDSLSKLHKIASNDESVRVISLTRNFGKEIAITAGLSKAAGRAVVTIDSDGQHPVELIGEFIKAWRNGAKVVSGLRIDNQKEGFIKRYGSKMFYRILRRFTELEIVPGATDYRLIDRSVQQEYIKMTERNRISRGLIDWLGYPTQYVKFRANPRTTGKPGYSFRKLSKLAIDSVISLSLSPLYISAYIGAIVLPLSTLVGLVMIINATAGDPLGLHATGTAYFVILLVFLVGVLLVSQGIIGLYLSHIHTEAQNRPLYIIDKEGSKGLDD